MVNYNLFLPPEHLAKKGRGNWNKKEAEEYKKWLLSIIDERTNNLLQYFDEQEGTDIEQLLSSLGKKVSEKLKQIDFSEEIDGRKRLTNMGYALAGDVGLLVAKYLLNSCGDKLNWTIIRKPKTEMSYNLPVLEVKNYNYFDPVGGAIAESNAIINDKESHDIWLKVYLFWKEKAR